MKEWKYIKKSTSAGYTLKTEGCHYYRPVLPGEGNDTMDGSDQSVVVNHDEGSSEVIAIAHNSSSIQTWYIDAPTIHNNIFKLSHFHTLTHAHVRSSSLHLFMYFLFAQTLCFCCCLCQFYAKPFVFIHFYCIFQVCIKTEK